MFAGPGSLDRGIERQQVGLLSEVVDDLNNFADFIRPPAQNIDNFRGGANGRTGAREAIGRFFHRLNALVHLFPGSLADLQQSPRRVSDSLNGSNHLLNGSGRIGDARSLHLRALHDVLDIDAHFVHRAGDFVDGGSRLDAHLRGFGRRRCHLAGSRRHARGAVPYLHGQVTQSPNHL